MEHVRLPGTLWELCDLALQDTAEIEESGTVTIYMESWSKEDGNGNICMVCVAGAVARQTLRLSGWRNGYGPHVAYAQSKLDGMQFDESTRVHNIRALYAIDQLRRGKVSKAYVDLHIRPHRMDPRYPFADTEFDVTRYEENPVIWREDVTTMRNKLKELGV